MSLAHRLFAASGLAALARRALVRGGRFALTFHGVAAQRVPDLPSGLQPSFTASEVDTTLTWLGERFDFLTPEQFLQGDSRSGSGPGSRPGILLTFDDGYANNRDQALPILRRHRAPAIFFVTTQHVLDPRNWLPSIRQAVDTHWSTDEPIPDSLALDLFDGMSAEALRECADEPLITIGAHSVGHPYLTRLNDDELAGELSDSKRTLEEMTGKTVDLIAYPTGDYDDRVIDAADAAGYRAAFAEDSKACGRLRFEIPRIGLYADRPWYLAAKTCGLHRAPLRGPIR